MKKKFLAMALSLAMVFTMLPVTSVKADDNVPTESEYVTAGDAPVENLARSATATAGYTNQWGAPETNMNDGVLANDYGNTSWNCYAAPAEKYPMEVKLTWNEAQTMSSMRVMWWADGNTESAGVQWLSGAKVQYMDGGEFKNIADVGIEHGGEDEGINGKNTVWNVVNFATPITTTELRMLLYTANGAGMGISEWEVFSKKFKEKLAGATVSGSTEFAVGQTVEYVGSTFPKTLENSATYAWSVPEESRSLIQIQGEANAKTVSIKALAAGDATLHLAATEDGITQETDFAIETMLEQDVLNLDRDALEVPGKITADYNLATISKSGYDVTWESDNDVIVISDGKPTVIVNENEGRKAKLTATITGKEEVTPKRTVVKDFVVFIPSKTNLAADAEVTGSFNGSWGEVLNYIKDGNDATAWNGCNDGTREGNIIPDIDTFTYTFTDKLELIGSVIRFKDDGGGVMLPEAVKFEYYDDNTSDWKTVSPDDGESWSFAAQEGAEYGYPGKDKDYGFKNKIVTNQIKLILNNRKNGDVAVGAYIYEWTLIGKKYIKPDLTSLNSLITQATALNTDGKDAGKVATFTAALSAAQAVAADKNPTQEQVTKACEDLETAYLALGGVLNVDKTDLAAAISAANTAVKEEDEAKYTPASWTVYANALQTAKDLNESNTATQTAVNAAVTALNKAVEGLTEKASQKDKESLDAAIASANAAVKEEDETKYTAASWKTYKDALKAVTDLKTNENATKALIDAAIQTLEDAIEGLKTIDGKPNRASLDAAIARAKNLTATDYTTESWAAVESALEAAENLSEDATQAEINKAAQDLNDAIEDLVDAEGDTPGEVNKTALNTAISDAKALNKDAYTAESWAAVETALETAENLPEDADQETVDAATKALTDAMDVLVEKDSNIVPATQESITTLTNSVSAAAKNYKKGNYTDATWNAFEKALKEAQDVLNNKDATEAQVTAAKKNLEDAIKALVQLRVTKKNVTLGLKETYSVKSAGCTYTTSDPKVADVNKTTGKVTTKKTGKAVISAINNTTGNVTEYTVTVKKAPKKISKVTLNKKAIKKKKATLKKGKSATLKVTLPSGTASNKITYKSSKTKVATVSASGKIKAKKKGKTKITIKTFNNKKMVFTLTVK